MLVWNPTDFLECLEVAPEVDEDGVSYAYTVDKDGMRLILTVFQYASDVYLSLYRIGISRPAFDMRLLGCSGTRHVNDIRGEYLEFAPAACFGNGYDGESPIPYSVRVTVNPSISIILF